MVNRVVSVVEQLASSLGRRDEDPNIALAESICNENGHTAIVELVGLLTTGTKAIRSNAIKVLYEIGYRKPPLIAEYCVEFVDCLKSRDNRLVWGALTALDSITEIVPKEIFKKLDTILKAAEMGSVIAKDHAANILIKLAAMPKYSSIVVPKLLKLIENAANNQFPMYCERAMHSLSDRTDAAKFCSIMESRMNELEKDSQRRRVAKILKSKVR